MVASSSLLARARLARRAERPRAGRSGHDWATSRPFTSARINRVTAAARLSRSHGPFPGARSTQVKGYHVGSVIKKRRKRMAKKKHRKLLKKTRVQRRKLGK